MLEIDIFFPSDLKPAEQLFGNLTHHLRSSQESPAMWGDMVWVPQAELKGCLSQLSQTRGRLDVGHPLLPRGPEPAR